MNRLIVNLKSKAFANGLETIRDLQFTVQTGEFVALVGPSGTGKTTLLNMLAGLESSELGAIQVSTTALSYMFQEPRLMPWLTVEENIRLVLEVPALKTDTARLDRLNLILTQLGLERFRRAFPKQLSGGLKRRVALARAFVTQPALLLMDEPFQSLDEPSAQELRQLLVSLWQTRHPTVVFVTHSLTEALQLADRILFLSARPAQLILDYTVPLARPRVQLSTLQALQEQLLQQYPLLLSGSLRKEAKYGDIGITSSQ